MECYHYSGFKTIDDKPFTRDSGYDYLGKEKECPFCGKVIYEFPKPTSKIEEPKKG